MADAPKITAAELQGRRRPGRSRHPAYADIVEDGTVVDGKGAEGGDGEAAAAAAAPPAAAADDSRLRELETELAGARQALQERERLAQSAAAEAEDVKRRLQRLAEVEASLTQRDARLAEQSAALASAQEQLVTFQRQQQKQSVDDLLQRTINGIGEDDNLNLDDVRALSDRVLRPALTGVIDSMAARSSEETDRVLKEAKAEQDALRSKIAALEERNAERDKQSEQLSRKRINDAVYEVFPDFDAFSKSQSFAEFSALTPDFSMKTFGSVMTDAYNSGDDKTLIKALREYKARAGVRPDPTLAAEVPTGTDAASAPAAKKEEKTYSYEYLADLREQMQRNEITRAQYRAKRLEFEDAERAGRVTG